MDAQTCPCGNAIESRTLMSGEREMHKEERDVLEEATREISECDMELGTLDSSEKTIAILGDIDGGQRQRSRKGARASNFFYVINGNNVTSAQLLEVSLLDVRTGAPSRKGCVVNGQMPKAGNQ